MASNLKTPVGDAPVIPLVILISGLYLAWFGVHFWGSDTKYPTTPIKNVLQGKPAGPPSGQDPPAHAVLAADVQGLQPDSGSSGTTDQNQPQGNASTGSAIANDALKYVGHDYLFGGAPGPDGKNPWDCSSFVNYVIGHDMGMKIPGGDWKTVTNNGNSHGPATTSWLLFGKAINRKDVAAGDIAVSANHMGIAIDNGNMISALNPALKTTKSAIEGYFPDPTIYFRRVAGG